MCYILVELKGYLYRLKPNKEQIELMHKTAGCCRFVYNYCLKKRIEAYQKDNTRLSKFDLMKLITQLKKTDDYVWLKEVNSQSLQWSIDNLDKAFTKFFREKEGFPNFKSKYRNEKKFGNPQSVVVDFENQTIKLPKIGIVKSDIHREFEGKIKTCTVDIAKDGNYYISVLVEDEEIEAEQLPIEETTTLGLDMGLKDFVTMSNGERVTHPKWIRNIEMRIKCLQRRHARKVKKSNNREKARLKVAKKYKHLSNQRHDFVHKLSHKIASDSKVHSVAIENLNIKGMTANHCLAKSVQDTCWNAFENALTYKLKDRGKNLIYIGRFEASSKTCTCGKINHELKLSDRAWTCPNCEVTHDRDLLAAQNVKRFALQPHNLMTSPQELGVELVEVQH